MSSFETSAQLMQALHAHLDDDVDVQSVLGASPRLYDHAPEDPVFPYLTYGTLRSEGIGGDDVALGSHTLNLHIWSRYCGRAEVIEAVAHVVRALERFNVSDDDMALVRCRVLYTDVFRAADGRTLHGLIRLNLITETLMETVL